MNEFNLSYVYYGVGIAASFIGIIGVIVTSIGIYKYLKYKRIDALVGFYSKLQWRLLLLKNIIGETNNGNNVLYYFCGNEELRNNLSQEKVNLYEQYRFEIIQLLLQSENQINLKYLNADRKSMQDLINELFKLLIKYDMSPNRIYLFTQDDQQSAANNEAEIIVKLINNMDDLINCVKRKYKINSINHRKMIIK